MTDAKAAYVKKQAALEKSSDRHCHWPGCRAVPPAMWGCKQHWFTLPAKMRNAVWRCYEPGQEISKTPSAEYLRVAHWVQKWIAEYLKKDGEPSLVLNQGPHHD